MINRKLTGQGGLKVKILREIGRGGFGIVYLARDDSGAEYAVKYIGGVSDPLMRASFRQEVESVAGLVHPGIAPVIDFGEDSDRGGNVSLFTVLEYFPEGDYRSFLKRVGSSRSWGEASREVCQVLEALTALHTRVIHRDLKPETILLKEGALKLTDFGLARFVDEATRTLTFKGGGTPRYMAPEAWQRGPVSPATDLYSVGILVYEVLCGEPPFAAAHVDELRKKHLYEHPPRLKARRRDVPDVVDGVVRKLLEKEARDRFASANEVLYTLAHSPRGGGAEVTELATRIRRSHDEQEAKHLAQQRAAAEAAEEAARARYKEQELLSLIDDVVEEVNQHFVETRIERIPGPGRRQYYFGPRALRVTFLSAGEIYGNAGLHVDTLRKHGVMHAGIIEIQEGNEDREGWNVVLLRGEGEIYGTWYLISTDFSPLYGRSARYRPFATSGKRFVENLAYHLMPAMHAFQLTRKQLSRDDILGILKVLVPGP